MNHLLLWFLIILVLVIVAFVFVSHKIGVDSSPQAVGVWEQNELHNCSSELVRMIGGAEKATSLRVLDKIMPYLKEVESPEHLENHLERYYQYTERELNALRNDSDDDTLAPKKYKYLHTLIADIIRKNNIYSMEEFLKRSRLTYADFLPSQYRKLLNDLPPDHPTKEDIKKVSKLFDKYFVQEGVYLTKSKLFDATKDLPRLFKLKSSRAQIDPKKLIASIEKDPAKVFELDYIGLIPEMQERATIAANAKPMSSSYNRRDFSFGKSDEELKRQFERDIETLRLLRDYPNTSRRELERIEIIRRLEKAASSLYSPKYVSNLLRDLYYEYPRKLDLGFVKPYLEREPLEERERRIRTEKERDESERGRKAALVAQEAADKAVAEGVAREEREREKYEKDLTNADEIRKQLIKEQTELAKLHASDMQDLRDEGRQPDFAAENLDPSLEELWRTGADEHDNIDTPMPLIPLN